MKKSMIRITVVLMVVLALAICINAVPPGECLGTHPNGYELVNPFCSGLVYELLGNCVLGHYSPCEVRVTKAYTGYHCSVHINNTFVSNTVHYESITHVAGDGSIVISEDCCPY